MEFPYIDFEDGRGRIRHRPYLPIVLGFGGKNIRISHALVDTGSDISIFPMSIARDLSIPLEDTEGILITSANGADSPVYPSQRPVHYTIEAKKGHRPISFQGTAYFSYEESTNLLGHYECLERFDLTFYGTQKKLSVLPTFKL